ncbi:MAG: glycoside hydrolase family 3 N-terminal domain-containing protein [Salinibacter sp.]|uniref:glycoside hydrolase family 3 N-terminal domain-containing protein n=1 Tax=Salinibacter sp. TaxID=2065818 RepID=UPI002FC3B7A1
MADAPPPDTTTQTDAVGQTGQQADPEGRRMALDRDISLLKSPEPPVDASARSSDAFIQSVVRDSATTSVENVDARVDSLLNEMTLEEKVGQMTQLTLSTISKEAHQDNPSAIRDHELSPEKLRDVVVEHHVGSILNVTGQAFSVDHWAEVMSQVQRTATEETRLGIPILYGIDAVHGANYTREAVLFPQNQGLAATWNLALAEETAAITARDVRASGIPWNFAPVLDLGREPRWPRLYETLGEDVHLATAMGLGLLRGYQETDVSDSSRVAATLKHYVGYSAPESGLDRTPARISDIEMREHHLKPFRSAIEAGAKSIMINSGEVNGVPAHASTHLLQKVLRDELGFEGVAVSDWLDIKKLVNVHHVAATEREATKMAVMAGVDMSMVPSELSFYDHLLSLVRDGEVPESRIDEAVRRILRLKFEVGLFEDPLRGLEQAEEVGSTRDRRVSLQAARESVTLLRNRETERGDFLLPLSDSQNVLVTGPTAHSMQSMHNGWSYTWQGGGAAQKMFPDGRPTLMEAVRERVGTDRMTYVPGATLTAPEQMEEAVAAARQADVAVVALGEGAYAETPGNLDAMALPEAQRRLLRRVANTGTPVALVLIQGRPRLLNDTADLPDAVLTAYNPGPEGGQALMEVLYGAVNPSGHLPYTYPRSSVGMRTYDRKYSEDQDTEGGMSGFDPLFAFGEGLSYTRFAYSDLTVSRDSMTTGSLQNGGQVDVEVTVTNAGDRRGKDVVQLYLSDLVASITPSVKKLVRFAKVDLAPGERTRLSFTLTAEDVSFIGRDGDPVVEPGAFRLQVEGISEPFELVGERFSRAEHTGDTVSSAE